MILIWFFYFFLIFTYSDAYSGHRLFGCCAKYYDLTSKNWYNTTMKKTIIIEAHQRDQLIAQLLETHKTITECEILSFSSWLNKHTAQVDRTQQLIDTYRMLNDHRQQFTILEPMIGYPEIIRDLLQFKENCWRYGISSSDLPRDNAKEQDIALAMSILDELNNGISRQLAFVEQYRFAESLTIYDGHYSIFEQQLIKSLVSKGSRFIPFEATTPQTVDFFHGLNQRQEFEGCAQWIVNHKILNAVIICCDPHALPLLSTVFDRYRIPLKKQVSLHHPLFDDFHQVLAYLLNPSYDTLKAVVINQIYPLKNTQAFLEYLNLYPDAALHIEQPFARLTTSYDFGIINSSEQEQLLQCERQAEITRQELVQLLPHEKKTNFKDALIIAYQSLIPFKEPKALVKCRTLITEYITDWASLEHPFPLFRYLLEQASLSETTSQGFPVCDLKHLSLFTHDTCFVLGANQASFPQISVESGCIDEAYLEKIPDYPSLSSRIKQQTSYINTIYTCADHMIYSYADGNYEGKSSDVAFEIENAVQQADKLSRWPLIHHWKTDHREHKLAPQTAQSLFFKNGNLHGSVTRFEQFYQSPYQFFVKYGLGVEAKQPFDVEQRLIGTCQHRILEYVTEYYGKQYPSITEEQLMTLIEQTFLELRHLFPHRDAFYHLLMKRIHQSLTVLFEFLDGYEDTSLFTPTGQEVSFHDQTIPSLPQVLLSGYIDRIDHNPDGIRILDYKSSKKTLSKSSIQSGTQLQLLTYAIIAQQIFQTVVTGVYYINLSATTIATNYASFNLTKGLVYQAENASEHWISANQISGWNFADPQSFYTGFAYVKGLKADKEGNVTGSVHDINGVETLLKDVYQHIYTELSQGAIANDSISGPYQNIRQAKQMTHEIKQQFELRETAKE